MTTLPMPDLVPGGHPVRRAAFHYLLGIIQFDAWPAAEIVHLLHLVDFNRDGYGRGGDIGRQRPPVRLNGVEFLQSLIRAILNHLPGAARWDLPGGIARQPLFHGDGRQFISQQSA